MSLTVVSGGDILTDTLDKRCILVCPVAPSGSYKSGYSGNVKRLYPEAYSMYKDAVKAKSKPSSVDITIGYPSVSNAICMQASDNKACVDTEALIGCLQAIRNLSIHLGLPVYVPHMNGDSKRIAAIVSAVFYDVEAYLYSVD